MGIREFLRNQPGVASTVAGAVVIAAAVFFYFQWSTSDAALVAPSKSFISIDDGKSFLIAPADSLAPFTHDGKTAYQAYVFTCDGGKSRFVGYLERYSPRAKELLLEMRKQQAASRTRPSMSPELLDGIEVKRPGESLWIKHSDLSRAATIMDVRCSDANGGRAEMIMP